jgi:tRNA modification GTPase
VVAVNKSDLPDAWPLENIQAIALRLSVLTSAGLAEFREALLAAVGGVEHGRDVPAVTNIRHIELMTRALDALRRAQTAATSNAPEEFVLVDLTEARALLEEVTGTRTADDLIGHIFASFCIGK